MFAWEQMTPAGAGRVSWLPPRLMGMIRLWCVSVDYGNGAGAPSAPVVSCVLAGRTLWYVRLADTAANDIGQYWLALSGQGQTNTWIQGTETRSVQIAPRTPWIGPDDRLSISVEGGPSDSVIAAVLFEFMPWTSPSPRRGVVPRTGDMTRRPA